MFSLFVLLMLRTPGSRIHTEWWGILDLESPEVGVLFDNFIFSNSLIIHAEKTKEITTVKEVWICDLNYHKIW